MALLSTSYLADDQDLGCNSTVHDAPSIEEEQAVVASGHVDGHSADARNCFRKNASRESIVHSVVLQYQDQHVIIG